MNSQTHINALGKRARDRVTGLEGVVTSVCFDLYGCIQAVLTPSAESKAEGRWFDIARLEFLPGDRVMPVPAFDQTPADIAAGGKGPAEKPLPGELP